MTYPSDIVLVEGENLTTQVSVSAPIWDGLSIGCLITTPSGVDHIIINLGINDMSPHPDDAECSTKIALMISELETMITNIHTYDPNIKIGLCATIPPSHSQDSFAAPYGSGFCRWRHKRNVHLWVKRLISTFGERSADKIYIVPINTNLDTKNNMRVAVASPVNARNAATVIRQCNGVHPELTGYYQIADVIFAYLKSFES